MDIYLKEVESLLSSYSKAPMQHYANLSKLRISVPTLRGIIKGQLLSFQQFDFSQQAAIYDYIWNTSNTFEAMSIAIYPFQHRSLAYDEFLQIAKWIDRCSCWEHSDDLSKIYAQVLEEHPDWILSYYVEWNSSPNLWKRRQSIVGLLEYSSKRKKNLGFKKLVSFVEPLLNDDEYYVQKGIGWTLREIYNVYPAETLAFIETRLVDISSIAYSAATEKIAKEKKQELNILRKQFRNKR